LKENAGTIDLNAQIMLLGNDSLKGIVHSKMTILSSFKKLFFKNVGNQTVDGPN